MILHLAPSGCLSVKHGFNEPLRNRHWIIGHFSACNGHHFPANGWFFRLKISSPLVLQIVLMSSIYLSIYIYIYIHLEPQMIHYFPLEGWNARFRKKCSFWGFRRSRFKNVLVPKSGTHMHSVHTHYFFFFLLWETRRGSQLISLSLTASSHWTLYWINTLVIVANDIFKGWTCLREARAILPTKSSSDQVAWPRPQWNEPS